MSAFRTTNPQHFLPTDNGHNHTDATSSELHPSRGRSSVRIGNDTYTIRLRSATVNGDSTDASDTDDTDAEATAANAASERHTQTQQQQQLTCDRCGQQFARSYQLKRHVFVEHGPTTDTCHNASANGHHQPNGQSNGNRRSTDIKLKVEPLTPVKPPTVQISAERRQPTLVPTPRSQPINAAPMAPALAALVHPSTHPVRITMRTAGESAHIVCRRPAAAGDTSEYVCLLCPAHAAPFASARLCAVDEHLNEHNGTAFAHVCQLCDRTFASLPVLQWHVRGHCQPHSWQLRCELCEQRFRTGDQLQRHRAECVGRRLLACRPCGRTFAAWPLWHAHVEWAHGGRRAFRCTPCGQRWAHRAALQMHRQMECRGMAE